MKGEHERILWPLLQNRSGSLDFWIAATGLRKQASYKATRAGIERISCTGRKSSSCQKPKRLGFRNE